MGKPQTADIPRLSTDKFYIAHNNGSNITYEDVTDQHSAAVLPIPFTPSGHAAAAPIFDLQGRRASRPARGGLYIQGGKLRIW